MPGVPDLRATGEVVALTEESRVGRIRCVRNALWYRLRPLVRYHLPSALVHHHQKTPIEPFDRLGVLRAL